MSWFTRIVILLIALGIGNVIYKINQTDPIPQLSDTWWGPGVPGEENTDIHSFKINVPDKVLKDLQDRLNKTRPLTPPLLGIEHQYGINTNLVGKILDFWQTKYSWKKSEQYLNQYPQFKTSIQVLNIHYIHVKPSKDVAKNVRILPLLLLHGWPGSVREFYEIIPLLTVPQKGQQFVFELIIPSLPGYGFSDSASKPGLGTLQAAVIFKNLMQRLGYENKYYVQGGDWGSIIATNMALMYPDRIEGIHLNMCFSTRKITKLKWILGSVWPRLVVPKEQEHTLYPISSVFADYLLEFGYMHLQATKPDTVGVALNNSPAGLASYITEKFITWTNPDYKNRLDGGLKGKFTYTQILDNIMLYWITGSITTSMRFYSESVNKQQDALSADFIVQVPTACALFRNEIINHPPNFITDKYPNLIHHKYYDDGGHFAAFELPAELAADIWLAVTKFEELKKN